MIKKISILALLLSIQSCNWFKKHTPTPSIDNKVAFNPLPISYVSEDVLHEVSGLALSRSMPGNIWLHNDSGNPAGLHLVSSMGKYIRMVAFDRNRDNEDICVGAGPKEGVNYVYLADTGDNNQVYKEYYIYRFVEPVPGQTSVGQYEVLPFTYPSNASYDAETLMIDPKTKDLFIITKRDFNVKVFRLKYPQSINSTEAEFLGSIPFTGVTGGDISAAGDEILIKNYFAINYFKIKPTETIYQALARGQDISVPYIQEEQGEAIGWTIDAKGFYTMSEQGSLSASPPMYYYSKK